MSEIIQVEVPSERFAELEQVAQLQQRTVDELVRDMIVREEPPLLRLPADVEAELAAFEYLSDDVLWLLATSTMSVAQQEELANLNEEAQRRDLTLMEQERQDALLDVYHRVMVRRAHAALILKGRGYDINQIINHTN